MASLTQANMEARSKRGSRTLPVPLILNGTSEPRGYMPSPPATGAKSARTFNKQRPHPLAHVLPTMPYTPITPLQNKNAIAQEQDAHSDHSDVDSTSSQISPTTSLKRKSEEVEEESMPALRPEKQRILSSRLISNPIAILQQQGVPLPYIMHKIPEVIRPFYGRAEGASCFIRAVPQSCAGVTRIKVTPLADPKNTFYLRCKVAAEPDPLESRQGPVDGAKSFVMAEPMPLHIEAVFLRAPVLAQALLSGHVFVGDLLDIELPYPEIFSDLMRCLYTGKARRINREKIAACMEILEGSS